MENQSTILNIMATFKRELQELKQEIINQNIEINEDFYNNLLEVTSKSANAVSLVNAPIYFDHCYCDQLKSKCQICKFVEYVKYNNFQSELENYELLNIVSKVWVLIQEIKQDMKKLNKTDLDFLF